LSRPTFFPIVAHPREEVLVRDAGTNGTGGGISITIAPQVTISDPMASADDIKRKVIPPLIDAIRKDTESIVGEIKRKLEIS
jgi:hypothetical protein